MGMVAGTGLLSCPYYAHALGHSLPRLSSCPPGSFLPALTLPSSAITCLLPTCAHASLFARGRAAPGAGRFFSYLWPMATPAIPQPHTYVFQTILPNVAKSHSAVGRNAICMDVVIVDGTSATAAGMAPAWTVPHLHTAYRYWTRHMPLHGLVSLAPPRTPPHAPCYTTPPTHPSHLRPLPPPLPPHPDTFHPKPHTRHCTFSRDRHGWNLAAASTCAQAVRWRPATPHTSHAAYCPADPGMPVVRRDIPPPSQTPPPPLPPPPRPTPCLSTPTTPTTCSLLPPDSAWPSSLFAGTSVASIFTRRRCYHDSTALLQTLSLYRRATSISFPTHTSFASMHDSSFRHLQALRLLAQHHYLRT